MTVTSLVEVGDLTGDDQALAEHRVTDALAVLVGTFSGWLRLIVVMVDAEAGRQDSRPGVKAAPIGEPLGRDVLQETGRETHGARPSRSGGGCR